MDKQSLINKIRTLEGLTNNEKADLIQLLNDTKQYGLVWEEKPEEVERELLTKLPVLREVTERRILAKDIENDDDNQAPKSSVIPNLFSDSEISDNATPNHIIIEGDNLHALTALTFTHENKIDVIYIDPPYNTGNKDFKYNDTFVDKEDSYRHSKWLSFMNKRLQIAKRLLSENGVIFISIDDNEQSQLKILLDEIFGELRFVGNVIWRSSDNSNNDSKQFSSDHNYTLVYSKTQGWLSKKINRTDEQQRHYKNPDNDPRGPWFDGNPISSPNPRINLCYDIIAPNGNIIKPPPNGWRWSKDTLEEKISTGEIFFNSDCTNIKRKTYLFEQNGLPPSSLWVDLEQTGHNRQAKYELLKIFPEKTKHEVFATPKPVKLIRKIFDISVSRSSIVLDFFAGSGTTLQALIELNAEDKGSRQCILVTNNENKICEEITYERNRRVIKGYVNSKGINVQGNKNNNLRYYRTDFVSKERTIKNKRQLTLLATEMLCIKEDIYTELTDLQGFNFRQQTIRCFAENEKYLFIVYDEEQIEVLVNLIRQINSPFKIKVYVFSPGQYPFTEEFEDVIDKVEVCALPDAIYKAYMNVLPKKSDRRFSEIVNNEREVDEVESELFNENNLER